jgi:hypothetical protein
MIVAAFRTEKYEADLSVFEFDLRRIGVQKFLPAMSFTRGEIKDLIISRFGKVADATGLVDLLVSKTDCSPFALCEAFRFLVNNSFLSEAGGDWSLARINAEDLPEKLDPIALILDKVKDLNSEELSRRFLSGPVSHYYREPRKHRIPGPAVRRRIPVCA